MNAKHSDPSKMQEIYDIITLTQDQIAELKFTEQRFCNPETTTDSLISEGIVNRVLRMTEELGRISAEYSDRYNLDTRGARDVRNILAHAYGNVDRMILWSVITDEFPEILKACRQYAQDECLELE